MASFSVDQFKNGFFDRRAVMDAVGKASAAAVSKAGAYVRTRAKSSLRYRAQASEPGKPPSVHRDDRIGGLRRPTTRADGTVTRRAVSPLKEFIFFAWDRWSASVVVGPAATNQVFFDRDRRPVRGTVPGVLEAGGQITILEVYKWGKWRRADLRSRRRNSGLPQRYRTVTIAARPFMGPALDRELPRFVEFFRSSMVSTGSKSRVA